MPQRQGACWQQWATYGHRTSAHPSSDRSAEAAKQWNVGGRRQVKEPRGPTPPLLMEAAAWNGAAGGQQAGPPGGGRQGAAQAGRRHGPGGGSLALPVALRPLRSGSPFSQAGEYG